MKTKKILNIIIGTNNAGKLREIRDLLPKKIKIYSQTGEFITSLTDNRADSFIAIEWDTTDSNSNLLPNGTYLYTIEIKTENKSVKDTGVLSIIR